MKLFSKLVMVALIASLFVVSSCEKESDDEQEQMRVENLLIGKAQWNFVKAVGLDGSDASFLEGLEVGSTYIFNDDGTYGGIKGGTARSGTWILSNGGKTLTTTSSNDVAQAWNVFYISSSNLTLEYANPVSIQVQYFYN